jgi:polysaccharide biosynthesis protein PslG
MKNDSIFNRVPLPLMIAIWLGLVAVGAVLVYSVFFSGKPADSTAQTASKNTPAAQVAKATKPAATKVAAPAATQQPAVAQPTVNPKLGTDGLYPAMDFGYGVQVNGLVGDAKLSAELADKLHARWIKQQLQWGVFEAEQGKVDWTGFDNIINAAHDRGLRVMLSIPTAPQWTHPNLQPSTPPGENDPEAIKGPPTDPQAYANFVGQVIDRYKGKIQAIEVWNEQNLVREWRVNPQKIDAKAYIALLSAAYKTIKEKDPNIAVISGALSPTGVSDGVHAVDDFTYLQQMVDAGLLDVTDCVGAHHNGYNVGPNVGAKDAPSLPKAATATFKGPFDNSKGDPHHSWFFKDTLQGYNQILQGKKPICVTEFGWASSQDYGSYPPGFEFAQDNSVEEQGANIVEAYQLMKDWGFVKLAFLWNLDYGNKGNAELGPKDDPVPYSLIKTDGSKRASWDPVRKLLKQVTGDD